MMSNAGLVRANMPKEVLQKVRRFGSFFDKVLQFEAQRRNLIPVIIPALLPCSLLCVLGQKLVHFVFTPESGMPNQTFINRRGGTLTPEQVRQSSILELGFANPGMVYFDSQILDLPEAAQAPTVERIAKQHIEESIKLATRPRAISGYEGLQPLLDLFSQDHPEFAKNVLIAMRFRPGKQSLEIHEALKSGLVRYGLKGLRSDDKTYPSDGDLWTNICVYMMGCRFGVPVVAPAGTAVVIKCALSLGMLLCISNPRTTGGRFVTVRQGRASQTSMAANLVNCVSRHALSTNSKRWSHAWRLSSSARRTRVTSWYASRVWSNGTSRLFFPLSAGGMQQQTGEPLIPRFIRPR
jgi:hypothetical protein